MNPLLKFLVFAVLLLAGGKYGIDYILSNDFEAYADRTQSAWTCELEIIFGKLHFMRDDFDKAIMRYSHAMRRCPDSAAAEEAEFEMARCMEAMNNRAGAYNAYIEFIRKYPSSSRRKTADRAAEILHGN